MKDQSFSCKVNLTMITSWNPSPVCAAVSIPFLACLSVQVVLQPRMARNLEEGNIFLCKYSTSFHTYFPLICCDC